MELGDIYYWETDRVSGYDTRFKYHVFITAGDWKFDGNVFLFINKADYGGDYKITKADYGFFPLDYCFIGCGGVVTYSDEELSSCNPVLMGRLNGDHIKQLYNCVQSSETMPGYEIKLVCNAILNVLK